MEPVAKRARTGGGGSGGDRLSSLPDGLLHAIMSFLPARQMVQTCVLSKRWVDLWRSVPSLNLNRGEFIYDDDLFGGTWQKMEDFTTNLLMFHNAPTLDTFSISTGVTVGKHNLHVDRWIRRGIKYCPRVVDITFAPVGSRYRLPDLGSSACRLGRLHLSYVALGSCFMRHVRDSCPVLQCLELHSCRNEFRHIESSTLNKLVIEDSMGCSDSFAISAPRLASLCLAIPYRTYKNGVSLNGANSLVDASVTVMSCRISPEGEAMLLCGLLSVSNLELKGIQEMAILHEKFDKSPSFDNLRTLSLGNCFQANGDLKDKFRALGRLLEMCPNLEKLTLQHCWFLGGSTQRAKRKTRTSGLCLESMDHVSFHCQKLKFIEIKHDNEIGGDHQLFQLMWAFWRNLKNATIILTKNSVEDFPWG